MWQRSFGHSKKLDIMRLTWHVWKASYMPSAMSFQKTSKDSFVYICNWISPFWFANTATQKPWLCRGQIYPFNMRGLTNFYVTDPLVTHWRCSSSVAGIKWIRSWGVAALNCCEIPDKLSFSGSRARAEWVGGQMHEKRALPSAAVTVAERQTFRQAPGWRSPPQSSCEIFMRLKRFQLH